MKPKHSKNYIKEFLRILLPGGLLIFQQPGEHKTEFGSHTSLRRFKDRFRPFLPKQLLMLYYQMRGVSLEEIGWETSNGPKIEMYGIKREEMVGLLKDEGAAILDIVGNSDAGPHWTSFRYYVTKKKSSPDD